MKYITLFILVLLIANQVDAQKKYDNNKRAIYINFIGGYDLPQGDMKVRYGNNSNIGVQTEWITPNSNLIYGVNASFLYGNNVKEDIESLFLYRGVMLGTDQTATALYKKQRGTHFGVHFGKLFTINHEKNPRSGIRATLGLGYLRHWIKITDEFKSANQFQGDYQKGYDRLTGGLSVTPFIGYQHTALSRYFTFLIGVEYLGASTKSLRSWDYDLFAKDVSKRKDGLLGFKIGFSLPLYIGDSSGDVEYN